MEPRWEIVFWIIVNIYTCTYRIVYTLTKVSIYIQIVQTYAYVLLFIQFLSHRWSSRIKIIVKTVTFFQSLPKFLECLIWWLLALWYSCFTCKEACSLQWSLCLLAFSETNLGLCKMNYSPYPRHLLGPEENPGSLHFVHSTRKTLVLFLKVEGSLRRIYF
jgi:hypothetical protein